MVNIICLYVYLNKLYILFHNIFFIISKQIKLKMCNIKIIYFIKLNKNNTFEMLTYFIRSILI